MNSITLFNILSTSYIFESMPLYTEKCEPRSSVYIGLYPSK
nr:MAG TPA: hypothetical protein [Caudoviricetes sp.]